MNTILSQHFALTPLGYDDSYLFKRKKKKKEKTIKLMFTSYLTHQVINSQLPIFD